MPMPLDASPVMHAFLAGLYLRRILARVNADGFGSTVEIRLTDASSSGM